MAIAELEQQIQESLQRHSEPGTVPLFQAFGAARNAELGAVQDRVRALEAQLAEQQEQQLEPPQAAADAMQQAMAAALPHALAEVLQQPQLQYPLATAVAKDWGFCECCLCAMNDGMSVP